MRLPGLSIYCHEGKRFTWDGGRDEHRLAKRGEAPADPLHEAADRVAARYQEIRAIWPVPARKAG